MKKLLFLIALLSLPSVGWAEADCKPRLGYPEWTQEISQCRIANALEQIAQNMKEKG